MEIVKLCEKVRTHTHTLTRRKKGRKKRERDEKKTEKKKKKNLLAILVQNSDRIPIMGLAPEFFWQADFRKKVTTYQESGQFWLCIPG